MQKLQGHQASDSLNKVNNIVLVDSAKTVKSRNNNLQPTSKTQTESVLKKSSAKKSSKMTLVPKERPQTSKLMTQSNKNQAQSKHQQDPRRKPS